MKPKMSSCPMERRPEKGRWKRMNEEGEEPCLLARSLKSLCPTVSVHRLMKKPKM